MAGKMLEDGFPTFIKLSDPAETSTPLAPAIKFEEIEVVPVGADGGPSKNVSTMRNKVVRTFAPSKLITATETSLVVAYDPAVIDQIYAILNKNQLITEISPDGSSVAYWGFLRVFQPNRRAEGERPTANVTIAPSNRNLAGAEVVPDYTAPTA